MLRCASSGCRALGDRCMKAGDCCNGAACRAGVTPALRCLDSAECRAGGAACVAPEQCCSQRCIPDSTGARTCRASCVPNGAACAASDDCCTGFCAGDPGHRVCVPQADSDGGVSDCAGAGESCDLAAPRCCAGTFCSAVAGGGTYCVPAPQ